MTRTFRYGKGWPLKLALAGLIVWLAQGILTDQGEIAEIAFAAVPALQSQEDRTPVVIERPPVRFIKDPNPAFSAVAVDSESNMLVVADENLFQILEYDTRDNTPPQARFTEPQRVISGINTKAEMICGLYIDPVTKEIYALNGDTQNWMPVFSTEARGNATPSSVVAWIGAEMEFALSQAVASGDTLEHRPSECGHCVQDFLAELDLRDLPGEAAGLESAADDTLPTADLRFYPAARVVPCGHLPGHAAVAADLSNMAIPNGWIPRRLRSDRCVLWRRYNHIQGLPIPFPQQISCRRSIIGAVSQKARDRGIELIQEPG